jgi:hypothetical protein
MALDPNIALGVKPIELQNPLAQYAQMSQIQNAQNQNALAQFQLKAAQRGEQDTEALRNALVNTKYGTPEYEQALTGAFMKTGNVKGLQEYQKGQRENEKAATELAVKQQELKRGIFSNLAVNPSDENIKAHLQDLLIQKQMTPEEANSWLVKTSSLNPQQRSKLFNDLAQTADQRVGHEISRGQLGVAQGQLTLAQQNAAKPVWNEAGQSWITPPTAKNPAGTVTPVPEIKAAKDQQSAVKALSSAGYNPVTGEDTISKLISKSTSGGLETLSSAAIGHIFGSSTSGRKAIAALEGTANQIATDLVGGKLGAGISNSDRDFIVSALGDVANPMKPAGERLAGWEAAKERMMRTGMIPAPAGAGGASAVAVPPTPKGVDNSIWNAMTPEERALWK